MRCHCVITLIIFGGFMWAVPRGVGADEVTAAERARHSELDKRPIQQLTNVELGEYLAIRAKVLGPGSQRPHPGEDMGVFARRSLGQPFRLFATQFDLAESDCVSFVNRMLAMSVASDWQSYSILVDRIMHKDGIVDYRNRNFETLADWLPNNSWLLRDVTPELGPAENRAAQSFTHAIRPKKFVERPAAPGSNFTRITYHRADPQKAPVLAVQSDVFIPVDRLPQVLGDLRTGDVVLVLVQDGEPYLRGDHHGMIVRSGANVDFLHSSRPRVIEEPLTSFVKRCNWVVGFKFLRMRDNAREIAAQEVARLAPRTKVLSPADQDRRIEKLRAGRITRAAKALSTRPATRPVK